MKMRMKIVFESKIRWVEKFSYSYSKLVMISNEKRIKLPFRTIEISEMSTKQENEKPDSKCGSREYHTLLPFTVNLKGAIWKWQ